MKKALLLTLIIGLVGIFQQANAQQSQESIAVDVEVTYAQYLGKTPPLRLLVPRSSISQEKRLKVKSDKKAPPNFFGRGKHPEYNPNALPQGEDPIRQKSVNRQTEFEMTEIVNIDGLQQNINPEDPSGDIGSDFYLQGINATTLAVFDKEGVLQGSPFAANTIWNAIGFSSAGDVIILYDQEVNRWIVTEFPPGNQLLFAISDDADPMGSWTAYNFGTPNFPDYPKYGVWNNAYSVTTNEQGPATLPCYFIDREAILNGDPTVAIQRITIPGFAGGPGFQVATPVDWTGFEEPTTGPLILRMRDDAWSGTQDQIGIFEFNLDFETPGNTSVTNIALNTTPFDSNPCSVAGPGFSCIPQDGFGGGLDGLPEVIMYQPHYRHFDTHESIVLTFITDVSGGANLSGIRWMELRKSGAEDWTIYQEGTYAPDDGLDRFMPSIAMDGKGNIGLAYAVSSEDIFAGLRATGRRNGDELGEMTATEFTIVDGTNTVNSGSRFGDYAHMSIDPSNDRTFWFTAEYGGNGTNNAATRIFAFELSRDTTDIGPIALVTPMDSPDLTTAETVTIDVENFGLDTQSVFQVGYIFENEPAVVEDVNFELIPGAVYQHTFTPTVDMSVVDDYSFRIFTSLAEDTAPLNDTLRVVVRKLPRFDAGVSDIDLGDGTICAESIEAVITVTNFGTETLTSLDLEITLNGSVIETIEWTGSLAAGESEEVTVSISGFIDGTNELSVATMNPNEMADEIPANDAFGREFEAITNGVDVFLELLTDDYPTETTWELTDENNQVLAEGGPYEQTATLFTEQFCLDPEACYTFTIFDSYGDGICCDFGLGEYQIVDAEGLVLGSSDGVFTFQESLDFCATFMCMLDAEIETSPETSAGASDGTIFITPQNGVGPYQYSIDGGVTLQESPLFENLPAGDYDIVIIGEADCEFEGVATVAECTLDFLAEVLPNSDGTSTITVTEVLNGAAPFMYSLDGENFQNSPTFENVPAGDQMVFVMDAIGCAASFPVLLSSSQEVLTVGQTIRVFPNPSNGWFRVEINGLSDQGALLRFKVYNGEGKRIQYSNLSRYDNTYTGMVSLVSYPAGVYYLSFESDQVTRMVKVIKE